MKVVATAPMLICKYLHQELHLVNLNPTGFVFQQEQTFLRCLPAKSKTTKVNIQDN